MCRHSYQENWFHTSEHCSNLVPLTEEDLEKAAGNPTVPVNIRYRDENITHHKSFADLCNE